MMTLEEAKREELKKKCYAVVKRLVDDGLETQHFRDAYAKGKGWIFRRHGTFIIPTTTLNRELGTKEFYMGSEFKPILEELGGQRCCRKVYDGKTGCISVWVFELCKFI